jgi:hypothetical protein
VRHDMSSIVLHSMLRLIGKWISVGAIDDGKQIVSETGTGHPSQKIKVSVIDTGLPATALFSRPSQRGYLPPNLRTTFPGNTGSRGPLPNWMMKENICDGSPVLCVVKSMQTT